MFKEAKMIYYKTQPQDGPYYDLWDSPEWGFPFENKGNIYLQQNHRDKGR